MSNRRAKRERSEIRNRGRLRYLLAVLDLDQLQRCGVVPKEYAEKPNATAIERMLDDRLKTFQKADARFRRKPAAKPTPLASVFKTVGSDQPIRGKEVTGFIVDELHEIAAGDA